jgi:DNA-binding transcriptional LysR family regulator
MDRKQLRTLLAVAEHRSFSQAARALGTVQSNVSAHVARLERELGVTLIDRATTTATPEGLAVLERARRIEHEFDALDSDVASLRDVVSGSVRVGAIGTTARWVVPPFLTALGDEYPQVHVVILDAPSTVLIADVLDDTVDFALVNLPVDDPDLEVSPLFEEDRVLVVPEGHALHGLDVVDLADLVDHDLLLEPAGTSFRDVLDAAAADRGITLRAKAELDGMRLLASLAFGGYGAGIVPASAIPSINDGRWRWIPVRGVPHRTVGMVRRRRAMPGAAQRVAAEVLLRTVPAAAEAMGGIRSLGR